MHKTAASKVITLNYFLFLLLALIWSGSYINIKVVVDILPPVFCAMMRVLLSMIFLSCFFIFTRKQVFVSFFSAWRSWLAGFFTQGLPFALLFYGEKFVAPALAGVINSSVAIWALLLGTFIFRDTTQWTPLKIAGLVFGFSGILLIFAPYLYSGENSVIGVTAIMLMAMSYAIGGLINQHVIFKDMQVSFETNLFQQHVSSVLFLIATSLTFEIWPAWTALLDIKIILAFIYLGLIATSFAWIIYFHLIREWGAVRTTSVMYLVPVLAITWDLIFLHTIPTTNELLGAAAILFGVVLIQWKRWPIRVNRV